MTKVTTATVLASGTGWGPFRTPGWRVGWILQLVEGSSGVGPFLLIDELTQGDPSTCPRICIVGGLEPETLADALLLSLAACAASADVIASLVELKNVSVDADGRRHIGEGWELTPSLRRACIDDLAGHIQLAVIVLDDYCLLDTRVVAMLRNWGIAVAQADCTAGAPA